MKFPWREGDKIICINNDHSEEYLTVGKEYIVVIIPGKSYDNAGIICDKGAKGQWNWDRFLGELEYNKYIRKQKLKKIECTKLAI